jgi:hypothetical protein
LFDEDENMQIGREEFLKVKSYFRRIETSFNLFMQLERLISCKTNLANGIAKLDSESSSFTKTTLQVHLFGADGRDFLPFEKFKM